MVKLIFGCGYLGQRVARRWLQDGQRPVAVTHSTEHAAALARQGCVPLVADVTQPSTLASLPAAETVVYAVGYDRASGLPRAVVQVDGLRAALDALPHPPSRILYISSTAVYGDREGDWVDEDTPCRPDRESGRIALAAEEVLRSHPLADRAIVLRLAGLYGPDRIPRMRDLLAGRPLPIAADAVANLIHVEDAASVVLAAEVWGKPPATYVVSDGHPVLRREFYRYLAARLHLPPPVFRAPDVAENPEPPRGVGRKQVRSRRVYEELHVQPAYPTYREGLGACGGLLPRP